MFSFTKKIYPSKRELYADMNKKGGAFFSDERDWLINLSNASAFLDFFLEDINWVGFYLMKDGELRLGPFQGKPACSRIQIGKGVCGTAAKDIAPQIVYNVHDFEGHIACDGDTNSEIVIPMVKGNKLIGVLDIDSPALGRFDEDDLEGLCEFLAIIIEESDFEY